MTIRPMTAADLESAAAVSGAAFGVDLSDAGGRATWTERVAHPLRTDPDGAFVASGEDGAIVGVGQAVRRGRVWVLSLLTVAPGEQSRGAGRALLEACLGVRASGDAALIVSSNDPRAMRLYGRAGFRLLPTLEASGTVDRSRIPARLPAVTDGAGDLEALDAISRDVRGGPHSVDLPHALWRGSEILRLGDAGFVVTQPTGGVWLLVAREQETARALLWHALALAPAGPDGEAAGPFARWLTAEQTWAVDVLLAAGLGVRAYGAVCVDGDPGPLWPYIPSGPVA